MSEEQEQPNKWYASSAFVKAVVAAAIVICAAIILWRAIPSHSGGSGPSSFTWLTMKTQIQNAVDSYNLRTHGSLPTLPGKPVWSGNCTNLTEPLYIVNFNLLVPARGGALQVSPSSYGCDSGGCDNCGGGKANDSAYGCGSSNHYLWIMDQSGTVASICIGKGCEASNVSGYQGVWP